MKKEILRFYNVTAKKDQVTHLRNMSFYVLEGEVCGLLFFNDLGTNKLVEILKRNTLLEYGSIYFEEKLVNNHLYSDGSENSVMVIGRQLSIVGGLTVLDNLFILQPNYKSSIITHKQMKKLEKRLLELTREIAVDISPFDVVEELSLFHQAVTALLSGLISGVKLIVCKHLSNFLSAHELVRFHEIIRVYKSKGISFIYIGAHHEESFQICDHISILKNGLIIKKLEKEEMNDQIMATYINLQEPLYHFSVPHKKTDDLENRDYAFSFAKKNKGAIININFKVGKGECLTLLDADNTIFDCIIEEVIALHGENIAIVNENPRKSMLFPELSSLDNLIFTRGNRNPELWRAKKYKNSIITLYKKELEDIIEKDNIFDLSAIEQYKLIYYRVAIQNPSVVFLRQPFAGADMFLRHQILDLMYMLLSRKIAIVILAVSISDSLSVANRLQIIEGGRTILEYPRSKFEEIRKNRLYFLKK